MFLSVVGVVPHSVIYARMVVIGITKFKLIEELCFAWDDVGVNDEYIL